MTSLSHASSIACFSVCISSCILISWPGSLVILKHQYSPVILVWFERHWHVMLYCGLDTSQAVTDTGQTRPTHLHGSDTNRSCINSFSDRQVSPLYTYILFLRRRRRLDHHSTYALPHTFWILLRNFVTSGFMKRNTNIDSEGHRGRMASELSRSERLREHVSLRSSGYGAVCMFGAHA